MVKYVSLIDKEKEALRKFKGRLIYPDNNSKLIPIKCDDILCFRSKKNKISAVFYFYDKNGFLIFSTQKLSIIKKVKR